MTLIPAKINFPISVKKDKIVQTEFWQSQGGREEKRSIDIRQRSLRILSNKNFKCGSLSSKVYTPTKLIFPQSLFLKPQFDLRSQVACQSV